jgi:hypothetical protein
MYINKETKIPSKDFDIRKDSRGAEHIHCGYLRWSLLGYFISWETMKKNV